MNSSAVLIVDDNEINLKLLRIVLSKAGFEVMTAANAEQAVERVNDAKPAVILMDIQLPGTDGLALTRRFKSQDATKDIAIIAVTSYAMKGDEEKAIAAGCDGYLTKPVNVRTIADVIRSHLKRGV